MKRSSLLKRGRLSQILPLTPGKETSGNEEMQTEINQIGGFSFFAFSARVPERHPGRTGSTFLPIHKIQYLCALVKFNECGVSADKRRLIYAEEKAQGLTSIRNN